MPPSSYNGRTMSIDDILNSLEAAEHSFAGTLFLAPIVGRGKARSRVRVRIAGVACQLAVTSDLPQDFRGWAVLQAVSTSEAVFVREAGLADVAAYLELFPTLRLILCEPDRGRWLAFPAHLGDERFQIQDMVTLWLTDEGLRRFETVIARFDGHLFWYERRDPSRDPALAGYLRDELARRDERGRPVAPEALHKRGLSAEEKAAYWLVLARMLEAERDQVELRLSEALAHAGASLRDYSERDEAYVVRYSVDGRNYVSTVRQEDLTVMTAGICLAGGDRHFDLASLVGVLRQAQGQGRMVLVGDDRLPEADCWAIHPADEP
jgi:hypothetical protein